MNSLENFLENTLEILKKDERVLAVCAAGSWITKEIDVFSDLDLVIITKTKLINLREEMQLIAISLGNLVSSFTGEHVGENRLLICLYENPTLHVDLKFLTQEEFTIRVENPTILWERDSIISNIYTQTNPDWPTPSFQWIEDRFWVWIHYTATKLGRGELLEAIDFLSYLRNIVIGPLFHLKYKSNPRGVRKLEFILSNEDIEILNKTIPEYTFESIYKAIQASIEIYLDLRKKLFDETITLGFKAEQVSLKYLEDVRTGKIKNNL